MAPDSMAVLPSIDIGSHMLACSLAAAPAVDLRTGWTTLLGAETPFQIAVAVITVANALWTSYFSFFQRPKLQLHIGPTVGIVVSPAGPPHGMHVRCSLVNVGVKLGTLQHLEATVHSPDGHTAKFRWNIFFKYAEGGGHLVKEMDVHALAVAGRDSVARFIEFRATDAPHWREGKHHVEFLGWVDCADRSRAPNMRSQCHLTIGKDQAARINGPGERMPFTEVVAVDEWSESNTGL